MSEIIDLLWTPKKGDWASYFGNDAILRGALESAVMLVTGYPGTPASNILDSAGLFYKSLPIELKNSFKAYIEVNEAIAMSAALGASQNGFRSLVAVKHVGFNVLSDVFSTACLLGPVAGIVVLNGGDPGALSSQNEQDNRWDGMKFGAPVIEPSSPQELKDFVKYAFELSEHSDFPVIYNVTTRLCHSRATIECDDISIPVKTFYTPFVKRPYKTISLAHYEKLHEKRKFVETQKEIDALKKEINTLFGEDSLKYLPIGKIRLAKEFAGQNGLNKITLDGKNFDFRTKTEKIGFITAGLSYAYLSEALREIGVENKFPILKLGVVYPIDDKIVLNFVKNLNLKKIIIVEELTSFIETQVGNILYKNKIIRDIYGKGICSKNIFPSYGEFNPTILEEILGKNASIFG